jgi:membrane protease YdiL (CAAX protease family)
MGQEGSAARPQLLNPWIALAAMAAGTIAMVAASPLAPFLGLRTTLIISETLLPLPGLLALLALAIPVRQHLGLVPVPQRQAILSVLAGLTLWMASLGLFELQYTVWAPPESYLRQFRWLHEQLRPAGPVDAIWSVAAIAIVPAVCEEILVRGIVLPAFARPLGGPLAVVVSAGLFGLMHLDGYRFPFTFAVGLALGAIRLRTGALLPVILAHAALNALTFSLAPLIDEPSNVMPEPQPLLGMVLLMFGGSATLVVLSRLRSLTLKDPPPRLPR